MLGYLVYKTRGEICRFGSMTQIPKKHYSSIAETSHHMHMIDRLKLPIRQLVELLK